MNEGRFDELENIFQPAGAASGIAELHGTLTGILCADPAGAEEKWLNLLAEDFDYDTAMTEACEIALGRLFQATRSELESSGMTFYPLLPDDRAPLDARAQALALWCHGFLYGTSMGPLPSESELSAEFNEVMADFAEITKAELDENEDPEQAERAYAELVEFVRVGAQLVFEELRSLSAKPRQLLH